MKIISKSHDIEEYLTANAAIFVDSCNQIFYSGDISRRDILDQVKLQQME